jgi:hypothetical protein
MYSTQFAFLVDRPVSSGLEQRGAFRETSSGASVGYSRHRAQMEAVRLCLRRLLALVEQLQQLDTVEQRIKSFGLRF